MGLNLSIVSLTFPAGTEFPPTMQALADQLAEYLAIAGGDNFSGINYGPVEPGPDDRDKPWFKTDNAFNPIGWFSWDGLAWDSTPLVIPGGTTANRPTNATTGQLYDDTDIGATLKWNGAAWITLAGTVGDIKEVKAVSLAVALANNPGWAQDTDSTGMVIAGASDGSSAGEISYGTTVGEVDYTLTLDNLPSDGVSLLTGWGIFPGAFQNGPQAPGVNPITTGLGSSATKTTGPINPNTQVAVPLYQPTMGYWRLVKTG